MSEDNPESAFSLHAKKRKKNTEQQMNYKKRKNMHLLEVSDQNSIKQMIVKDKTQKQQNKDKYSLNISRKSKGGIVTEKGNLRICKQSSLSTAKLMKPTNKIKRMNKIQQLDQINNVQNVDNKSKLKAIKQKEKSEKETCDKRETIETIEATLREATEEENDDSYLNYIESHKNTLKKDASITFGGPNPILSSLKLFEWLIQPLKVKKFFT